MPGLNGYPTKEELKLVKTYSGYIHSKNSFTMDVPRLLEILQEIWWLPDWGIEQGDHKLELHTGGWSGNEEIINVLQESMFWVMYWQKSERGGHYYFELEATEEEKKAKNK